MSRLSRRRRGTVTIQDVANAAGVSAMTVSRVVNDERNVRESTRAAVLDAIQRLNYSPNAAARSLAAGEASRIGLIYANPSAAYLSQFLVGALKGARKAGCYLVLEACESEKPQEQAAATRRFVDSGIDGVVLAPPLSQSAAIHAELAASDTPLVTVAMGLQKAGIRNVRIDDFAAAFEITQHLISLGHRHLGFIPGHPDHVASIERERGFKAGLEAAGIDPTSAPVEQGYFSYRSGLAAAERLLERKPRPTAIFACNDDMAAATVNVAHRRGLNVPRDLSIVGFDDTAPATTVWPELTTVRQPVAAMAEAAIELLVAGRRADKSALRNVTERVLAHELILRDSTAPPRKRESRARRVRGSQLPTADAAH
jgi:LacI family transcriptional regulator